MRWPQILVALLMIAPVLYSVSAHGWQSTLPRDWRLSVLRWGTLALLLGLGGFWTNGVCKP